MMDLIRCPACRGAKKVPKLGGMIGDCNLCKGTGLIDEIVRVEITPIIIDELPDIKKAVAEAIPFKAKEVVEEIKPVNIEDKPQTIDGKKAIFKRKKA